MPKISYWYDKNKKKEYLKEYHKKYQELYRKRKKEIKNVSFLEVENKINNVEDSITEMKNELEEIEKEYFVNKWIEKKYYEFLQKI
jgi:hypothetical protein